MGWMPHQQEERRQAAWDRLVEDLPVCGCCGHSVYPNDIFYELKVKKETIIVCADCHSDMVLSETILEK